MEIDFDKVYASKSWGQFKIVNYTNSRNVEVEFIDTGTRMTAQLGAVREGKIKDYMYPSVYGVACLGAKILEPEDRYIYRHWVGIIERIHRPGTESYRKYKDCSVAEQWLNFQNYMQWFKEAPNQKGWQLDKDLLVLGNRQYGPETCAFVPPSVNQFLVHHPKESDLPVGVCFHINKGSYMGSIRVNGKSVHLGVGDCPEDLFLLYKSRKEQEAKNLAEQYKDSLDPRAYESLNNYTVGRDGRLS